MTVLPLARLKPRSTLQINLSVNATDALTTDHTICLKDAPEYSPPTMSTTIERYPYIRQSWYVVRSSLLR